MRYKRASDLVDAVTEVRQSPGHLASPPPQQPLTHLIRPHGGISRASRVSMTGTGDLIGSDATCGPSNGQPIVNGQEELVALHHMMFPSPALDTTASRPVSSISSHIHQYTNNTRGNPSLSLPTRFDNEHDASLDPTVDRHSSSNRYPRTRPTAPAVPPIYNGRRILSIIERPTAQEGFWPAS